MFKLLRLHNLRVRNKTYTPREIPPEKDCFRIPQADEIPCNIKLVAVFDASVKYRLIETYGMDCFTETSEGLRFEMAFPNSEYLVNWLLGFAGKVRVLEPPDIAKALQVAAKNILENYK